jgi:putative oxidoreductase
MLTSLKTNLVPLVLRLSLGLILLSQGYLKLVVGEGYKWVPEDIELDPNTATLIAWAEVVGGAALVFGLLTRLATIGIGVIQAGAIFLVMGHRDFIPNQMLHRPRGFSFEVGWEYNFAILAMCFSLLILGAGALSLDHFIRRQLWPQRPAATRRGASTAPVTQRV